MYHIPNDKRAYNSAKKIGEGMIECLKTHRFADVTVSDVQRASGVGRGTFYRLFDNTVDVLQYLCDHVFAEGLENEELWKKRQRDIFLYYIEAWMEQDVLVSALVEANQIDILYRATQKQSDEFKERLLPMVDPPSAEAVDYLMAVLSGMCISMLTVWVEHGRKETPKQVCLALVNAIRILDNSLFKK